MHQQNRLVVFYCVLLLSACAVHATLQSRTTQGTSWTGQVNLKSDVIRVNAMPYYLDVEEEIIIAPYSTSGTTPTGNQSTMEMYGTFNLPANAVIVSALLWLNDTTILKAKLKPKSTALAQYETVVNRQSATPPKPRDPIIIEQVGTNQYNLAVYPVTWTGERKMRIRYLTPQVYVNGELKLPLSYVFGAQVQKLPTWFEISIKSSTLSRIIYEDGQAVTTVQLPSTFMKQYSTLLMYLKVPAMTKTSMVNTYFSSNIWYGDYLMLWAQVPDSIIVKSKKIGSLASVAVAIKNDRKTYTFSFPGTADTGGIKFQPLRFASQSSATWDNHLVWTGYTATGSVLATYSESPAWLGQGQDTALAKLFAGSDVAYSEVYTKGGLGYLYGIVDMSFSLLALETDKVSEQLNAKLADSGAPYLLDTEIFKPNLVTTSIHAPNTGVNPAADAITFVQTGRNAYRIQLGDRNAVLEIRIADSKGRIIASWSQDKLAGRTSIDWNATDAYGRLVGKGVYFVNVICKNTCISKAVIVL